LGEPVRDFITAIAGSTVAWPLAAHAQQGRKLPTIGFLGPASASAWSGWTKAFAERLRELGWIEGRTVAIEFRWADGRTERFGEIASELVQLKVDVIVTSESAVAAAKQATSKIPIVFAVAVDPLGTGLIASLARPGGNVTGLSLQGPDLAGKRLELLREIVPDLRRLAILVNIGYPAAVVELGEVQRASGMFGFEVFSQEIRRADEIEAAFDALKGRADRAPNAGKHRLGRAAEARL
jgi:putative ABC transport system substrate-binding protein